ncbi:hypothetical protein KW807_02120 [Candidatus Parcubacteria bacterium]|nr:hypothetical protein [Candidatus Parcubacteria bacterium]
MFALLLACLSTPLLAQSPTLPEGTVAPLEKLSILKLDQLGHTQPCGEYFRFTGVPTDPTKVGSVLFIFDSNTTKQGGRDMALPMLGSDKLRIRVVKDMKTPTVNILHRGGPIYPWVEISISPADLEKAPCLKYSKFAV